MKKLNNKAKLMPLTIAILTIILGSLFMIMFISSFLTLTNPNSEVLQPKYGLSTSANRLNQSISGFSSLGNNLYTQMGSSKPSATEYLFLIFQGAFYMPLAFLGFVFSGIQAIGFVLFGAGSLMGTVFAIAVSVIMSTLSIYLVMSILKTIRTGDAEN